MKKPKSKPFPEPTANPHVSRFGQFDYRTTQKEFFAIEDEGGLLACGSSFKNWEAPELFSDEKYARSLCGSAGHVVKVTLTIERS